MPATGTPLNAAAPRSSIPRRPARRWLRRLGRGLAFVVAAQLVYFLSALWWGAAVTGQVLLYARATPLPRLDQLPPDAVRTLLAVEDPSFRSHPGIDPSFAPGQGTVTLTRSLVHTLYLDRVEMDGVSGVLQSIYRAADRYAGPIDLGPDAVSLVLNRRLSKDEQIRVFLAHTYMGAHDGRQVIGFPAAATAYYGAPLAALTRRQFTELVAMVIAPNRLHPHRHWEGLSTRVNRIERLVAGECTPEDVFDVFYKRCEPPRTR